MKKILKIVAYLFIIFIIAMLLLASYSSFKDQQLFSKGDKEKTVATIQIDEHNVKTYNYQGIEYGVDASKSKWKDGDKVTVYYLKDTPYIVAENPYIYHSKTEILVPLIWVLILLGVVMSHLYIHYLSRQLKNY